MKDIALYIHIPFCRAKCAYCDFNSYPALDHLHQDYVGALGREISQAFRALPSMHASSLYLGGGTPTVLSLKQVRIIMEGCRSAFTLDEATEVSCEANPGTVDEEYFRALRMSGVNRLSLGVQSFEDQELALLGRIHGAQEAREACCMAKRAGFDNLNLDLIYGLPAQDLSHWRCNIDEALSLEPQHLSLYSLSLEEGTPLWKHVNEGRLPSPDDDLIAEMYLLAEQLLERAGYHHYEISNWAVPGHECRHNLSYWHNQEYLGFGAGAHSYHGRRRSWNVRSPEEYISRLAEGRGPTEGEEVIDKELEMAETIILALRLVDGAGVQELTKRFGADVLSTYAAQIDELVELGLLEVNRASLHPEGSDIRLTQRGRLLGNEVFQRFLPEAMRASG